MAGRVPDLQLDLLSSQLDCFDLEVDPDRRNEGRVKSVVAEPKQDAGLADTRVADEQELEQQIVALLGHDVCLGWFLKLLTINSFVTLSAKQK